MSGQTDPAAPASAAPPNGAVRVIAHLDMDAFYASVELLRRPQLRGLPLVVGGRRAAGGVAVPDAVDPAKVPRLRSYAGRGVVTTASYEARALGVHSGMGLVKAGRLAPDALLLPADFDRYRELSRRFKEAVGGITPQIEDRGIDEIYIEFTARVQGADPWASAAALARDLQQAVASATGLTCSLGIAPNKLLAKIASDLHKPAGVTVITPQEIRTRIWPLPARRINGIGPRAAARLAELGLHTVGDLAAAEPARLAERFGRSMAQWMLAAAHGRDERPVVTARDPRSVSRETTFERDLHPREDRAELALRFTDLCQRLADDLIRKDVQARTIGIKLRYEDFSQLTRDLTLEEPTVDATTIRRAAAACLRRAPLERRLRLLGVRASSLSPSATLQRSQAGAPSSGRLFD